MNACVLCGRIPNINAQMCLEHIICLECGIKSYFTDAYKRNPCCLQLLDDSSIASLHEAAKCRYHLTSYFAKLKHQKRTEEYLLSRQSAEKAQPISIVGKHPKVPKSTNPYQDRQEGQKCSTCDRNYDSSDGEYQCPSACQCKDCSIETALRPNSPSCSICRQAFSAETIERMKAVKQRCHVCGITLPLRSFAQELPCRVCLRCVEVVSTETGTREMQWVSRQQLRDYQEGNAAVD